MKAKTSRVSRTVYEVVWHDSRTIDERIKACACEFENNKADWHLDRQTSSRQSATT